MASFLPQKKKQKNKKYKQTENNSEKREGTKTNT